jgi:hypothetical protein
MRVLVAALLLALTGCGSAGERSPDGPATSGAEELTPSVPAPEAEEEGLRPPALVLVSDAGVQRGVQGSSCVQTESAGLCSDTAAPDPERLSVVRPGEAVEVVVEGAGSARGKITILRLGCDEPVGSHKLTGATTSWAVDLEPGAYELDVFVGSFETPTSRGDTSASLGLLVDDTAPLELVPPVGGGC